MTQDGGNRRVELAGTMKKDGTSYIDMSKMAVMCGW
jgi:hypothetical protein